MCCGNTCSSSSSDKDKTTEMSDQRFWRKVRVTEARKAAQEFLQHEDTITLVNTNAEALSIGAEYAVEQSAKRGEILWQWPADNTICREM